jgi:molecular chaperone GrpE
MEKDQNINIEGQDSEHEEVSPENQNNEVEKNASENIENIKEVSPENQNNEVKKNASENIENIKEVTPEEKIIELEDKIARAFAEMENQRRRFEKEREDAFNYGGFAFAKETLNLIDNLERSKQILENDEALRNTEALKKTLEHFDIINKDMVSILSKNGITPVDSIGKKLDPNIHQAMMEINDDQKEPGTIVQEIQKGFMLKDRLLRPSLVGVSKKTENKEEKSEQNKENLDN